MIYEFIKYHIKTKYGLDRGQVWKNDIELAIIKIQYKKIIFILGNDKNYKNVAMFLYLDMLRFIKIVKLNSDSLS